MQPFSTPTSPPCGFVMFQRVEKRRIGSKWVNFELVLLVLLVFVYLSVYRYLTVLQVEVPTFFFEFVIWKLSKMAPSGLIPSIVWQNSTRICFRKQIFRRFSLGLIFGFSKILIICCGFIVQISENIFMYVGSGSKERNYHWILWSRIDAKNPVFVTASQTSFFSVSFYLL